MNPERKWLALALAVIIWLAFTAWRQAEILETEITCQCNCNVRWEVAADSAAVYQIDHCKEDRK